MYCTLKIQLRNAVPFQEIFMKFAPITNKSLPTHGEHYNFIYFLFTQIFKILATTNLKKLFTVYVYTFSVINLKKMS